MPARRIGTDNAGGVQRFASPMPKQPAHAVPHSPAAPTHNTGGPMVQMWQALSKVPGLVGQWESHQFPGGFIDKVRAKGIKLAAKGGKIGTQSTNRPQGSPPSWAFLKAKNLTPPKGPPNYVRMHMLNNRLGGPGTVDNLAPGSSSMNSRHYKDIEQTAVDEVKKGGEIHSYDIDAYYQGPSAKLKGVPAKAAWEDTLGKIVCDLDYTTAGGMNIQVQKTIRETPKLDRNPNWKGL